MPDLEPPVGLRPERDHDVVITAEAWTVRGFKKVANAGGRTARFTIECDEGPGLGGEGSAPTPLTYFTTALAF
jgi:hypothetical protein